MSDCHSALVPGLDSRAGAGGAYPDVEAPRGNEDSGPDGYGGIAIIEGRTFLRECIRRSIQSAFSLPVVTYPTVSAFEEQLRRSDRFPELVLFSLTDATTEGCAGALGTLSDLIPGGSTLVVLGLVDDADIARAAIRGGARGYIPCTMGFEIAVEAIRFILAGGTYVPMECLLGAGQPKQEGQSGPSANGGITRRELAVVRAIQQGKSNKIIAYELNLCESTVKVHVRNVMKKMGVRNRTEVAIKAQRFVNGAGPTVYADASG